MRWTLSSLHTTLSSWLQNRQANCVGKGSSFFLPEGRFAAFFRFPCRVRDEYKVGEDLPSCLISDGDDGDPSVDSRYS
jgi:hypothetical protein